MHKMREQHGDGRGLQRGTSAYYRICLFGEKDAPEVMHFGAGSSLENRKLPRDVYEREVETCNTLTQRFGVHIAVFATLAG
mmetsp:Transcript_32613/g.97429  ORF Transcript_32613/g.97429 Transcript_32613/m.97429 type:complete len:81 (+) Transcript_32613:153-395(+)